MSANKISHILSLMERLAKGEELYPQNSELLEIYEVNERTMRRYLEEIYLQYPGVVLTEKVSKEFTERKVTIYRVVDRHKDVSDTLSFFLENSNDLGWILQLVHENDPTLLQDSDYKIEVEKLIKQDEKTFLFKSSPFENIENPHISKIFKEAKNAVQNHLYRNISYHYRDEEHIEVKCLKLIYSSNNWYLAVEDDTKQFRLLRLAFIRSIGHSSKNAFQPSSVSHYDEFFHRMQNPMSLNIPSTTAVLRASSKIAIYFREGMKVFFKSQKMIRENENGSIDFSIEYTQAIEILPFIKQWLPEIRVLSPQSLQTELIKDLNTALEQY